jgi:hypothetical protein
MNERDKLNYQFADICNSTLFDVWQKTSEEIEDYEMSETDEATYSAFPQGMIVQYIPNGLIIMFGPPPEGEEYGEW